jgi:hypothetical protein
MTIEDAGFCVIVLHDDIVGFFIVIGGFAGAFTLLVVSMCWPFRDEL